MKLIPEKGTLEKLQTISTIFSLIAVPFITAWFGYKIQENLSNESIKKDYVQMAVNILSQPKKPNDDDLRKWSVEVLSKNSPVPFNQNLSRQLWVGDTLTMFAGPPQLAALNTEPPKELMKPPLPLLEPYEKHKLENLKRSQKNHEQVIELQKWITRTGNGWDRVAKNLGLPK